MVVISEPEIIRGVIGIALCECGCRIGSLDLLAVANEQVFKNKCDPVKVGPDMFVISYLNFIEFCIVAEAIASVSYLKWHKRLKRWNLSGGHCI